MVSYGELVEAIRKIMPDARIEESEGGEIIIYSGVGEEDGEVSEYK